jgi:hypothetical protein
LIWEASRAAWQQPSRCGKLLRIWQMLPPTCFSAAKLLPARDRRDATTGRSPADDGMMQSMTSVRRK